MNPADLQKRTKQFTIRIIKLVQDLEKYGTLGLVIGR